MLPHALVPAALAVLLLAPALPAQCPLATLSAGDGATGDQMGRSVAIHGDIAVLGAWKDEDPAGFAFQESGSAVVFERVGGTWTQTARLARVPVANEQDFQARAGRSVAVRGEIVLVGAPGYDTQPGTTGRGAAFVYRRGPGGWSSAVVLSPTASPTSVCGEAVALSGNFALLGDPGAPTVGTNAAGRVWVYEDVGGTWSYASAFFQPDGAHGDQFGAALAADGDRLLVGVPNGDGLATDSGVACVVERQGSSWSVVAKLMASDGAAGDRFGASVALLGDVALVGAPARDASGGLADAGAAYLFRRVGGTWTEVARADGTTAAEAFGESVAVSATHALVGVRRDDAAATDAGAAVVFDLATDLAAGTRFLSPLADGNDQFGIAVALDGDTALVGAFDEGFDQGPLAQYGAGFLFRVGGLDADADGLPDSCETFTGTPFCFGDGSGSACPCGNASTAGSNAGCENSLGRGGTLTAQGAASVAADGLVLTAAYLPPLVPVLVFQGDAQVAGGSGAAFGDGLRCAGGAIVRIAKPVADAAGGAQVGAGLAGVLVSDAGAIPAAGGTRCYQGWYRNAASYCTSATFNLTNAVSVTWAP